MLQIVDKFLQNARRREGKDYTYLILSHRAIHLIRSLQFGIYYQPLAALLTSVMCSQRQDVVFCDVTNRLNVVYCDITDHCKYNLTDIPHTR